MQVFPSLERLPRLTETMSSLLQKTPPRQVGTPEISARSAKGFSQAGERPFLVGRFLAVLSSLLPDFLHHLFAIDVKSFSLSVL